MDDKWFKQRQKIAGITAEDIALRLGRDRSVVSRIYVGRQRMSFDQAKVFADMLNVPISEVLERAGIADAPTAAELAPGFAEGDAAPWAAKGQDDRRTSSIGEALGARAGVDIWRIKGRSMTQAGYLPGDFMLVDTHVAERVKPGDVVVAQVYNRNGSAVTVLRRWAPPVLVAATSPGEDEPVYVVDNNNVSIRGKVVASWRF